MMKLSKIPAPKASNNNAKRVTGGDWVCHFSNCDKDFGDKSTLDRHIKTNHLKLSQVKCAAEGCGRLYSDKYTWQNHSKRTPGHDHCEKVKRNQAVLPTRKSTVLLSLSSILIGQGSARQEPKYKERASQNSKQ